MNKKMGPSKPYKSTKVEVEVVEETLDEGGIPSTKINIRHFFAEHPESDDEFDPIATVVASHYSTLLQMPQQTTKRRKISVEPIIDYTLL